MFPLIGYGSVYSDRYSPYRNDALSKWLGSPIGKVSTDQSHRRSGVQASHASAACVLLVRGLPGHAEDLGDLLPGPAVGPCVVHLKRLELLQQPAEGSDGPEPGARVRAIGRGRQGGCVVHVVNLC